MRIERTNNQLVSCSSALPANYQTGNGRNPDVDQLKQRLNLKLQCFSFTFGTKATFSMR